MQKTNGFTLAETLITLMILGVIAAMTIPSLMYSAYNRDNVARLKKLNGTLSSATNMIQLDEGQLDGWDWDNPQSIIDFYKPKLAINSYCEDSQGCFSEGPTKALDDSMLEDYGKTPNTFRYILADGSMIAFFACIGTKARTCDKTLYGVDPIADVLGSFIVDVNGPKAPNTAGKDIFAFVLIKDKGLQVGGTYSTDGCDTSHNSKGLNCGALVIKETQISYW